MLVVCSPKGIVSPEFPRMGMRDLQAAGFPHVLLDFSLPGEPFVDPQRVRPVPGMDAFLEAGNGISMPLACAPYAFPLERLRKGEENAPARVHERIEQGTMRAIRTAAERGSRAILVRPLMYGVDRASFFDVNRAFYLRLARVAQEAGIAILITPDRRQIGGHFVRGELASGRAMAAFIDALNEAAGQRTFGCCLDMQTAGGCGQDMYAFLTEVGARVQAVILTDTDGNGRKQLLPYTLVEQNQYETDWLAVIRGLRAIHFDGMLVLALRDTAGNCPPLLRPTLLALAKKTGDYLAWQIGMENEIAKYDQRVLFGAGRMCRNYLLNYGEQYPPLYTCDNNPKMWGTEVDGLPVKSPEELRTLPPDCAIFICNIYYREIEAQLKDMGLPNPIAYFNDECPQKVVLEKIGKRK